MTNDADFSIPKIGVNRQDQRLAAVKVLKRLDKKKIVFDANYPYEEKLETADYEQMKQELQIELLKMQSWVKESGQPVVILFEGRDAAGKGGGTIKRMMEHMNPRGARVVALEKPSDE